MWCSTFFIAIPKFLSLTAETSISSWSATAYWQAKVRRFCHLNVLTMEKTGRLLDSILRILDRIFQSFFVPQKRLASSKGTIVELQPPVNSRNIAIRPEIPWLSKSMRCTRDDEQIKTVRWWLVFHPSSGLSERKHHRQRDRLRLRETLLIKSGAVLDRLTWAASPVLVHHSKIQPRSATSSECPLGRPRIYPSMKYLPWRLKITGVRGAGQQVSAERRWDCGLATFVQRILLLNSIPIR